jgi:hypothetical protein
MVSEYSDSESQSGPVGANHPQDTDQDEDEDMWNEDMEDEPLHTKDTYHGRSGTSQVIARSPKPKHARKPGKPRTAYVRKWGLLGLSMTANYAKRSGWGSRAGFRELVQNMYPPLNSVMIQGR